MSLEEEVEQLKRGAAAIVENAARRDGQLSRDEDQQVMQLLERAQMLEHEAARARRKCHNLATTVG